MHDARGPGLRAEQRRHRLAQRPGPELQPLEILRVVEGAQRAQAEHVLGADRKRDAQRLERCDPEPDEREGHRHERAREAERLDHGLVQLAHRVHPGGRDLEPPRDPARGHALERVHQILDPQRLDWLPPAACERDHVRAADHVHHAAEQPAVPEHEPESQDRVARRIVTALDLELAPPVMRARPVVRGERGEEDEVDAPLACDRDQALRAREVHAVGIAVRGPVLDQRRVDQDVQAVEGAGIDRVRHLEPVHDRPGRRRRRGAALVGMHLVAARGEARDRRAADEAARARDPDAQRPLRRHATFRTARARCDVRSPSA